MNFSIHGRAAAQAINRCDSDAPESRLLDTLAGGRQSGVGDISKPSVIHRTHLGLLATAVRNNLRGMRSGCSAIKGGISANWTGCEFFSSNFVKRAGGSFAERIVTFKVNFCSLTAKMSKSRTIGLTDGHTSGIIFLCIHTPDDAPPERHCQYTKRGFQDGDGLVHRGTSWYKVRR